MLIFDSSGTPTSYSLNLATLSFDDTLGWLGLDANGNYALDTTPAGLSAPVVWQHVGGSASRQRKAARPTITSLTPPRGLIGTVVPVTINGKHFGTTPQVTLGGAGVTPTIVSATDAQIVVNLRIAANVGPGNHALTVKGPGGTSLPLNFFVQVPTSLTVLGKPVILATGSPGGCTPGSDYGIEVAVTYQVIDQTGQMPILSNKMEPQEQRLNTIFNGVPQPDQNWVDFTIPNSTSSNGVFVDTPYGACGNGIFTVTFTQNIRMLVGGQYPYVVRMNNTTIIGQAPGHGLVTNKSDVQASR